jgi:hypothetical protein
MNLFRQNTDGTSLPVNLGEKSDLVMNVEWPSEPGSYIKKIFSKDYDQQEYKTKIEIYYFSKDQQKYLSQQIFLFKSGELITRCTSYFPAGQAYLVPGSCAGVKGDSLYGVAIYK